MRLSKRLSAAQLSPQWAFPGVPKLEPFSEKPKPSSQTTVLDNGLRVVSQETYRTNTSLGLFVDAGSRFETDKNHGISQLLEHMAFKSTNLRSHQRLVRDVEDMGAQVGASSAREYFCFTADSLRSNAKGMCHLLSETVQEPKFPVYEVDEQRKIISFELHEMEQNAQELMTEMIYQAAFGAHTGLGRSVEMPKRNVDKLGSKELKQFYAQHFTDPKRMVLSAAGVSHEELVSWAKEYFGKLKSSSSSTESAAVGSPYQGGEQRLIAESPLTQISCSFAVGGWQSPSNVTACVLHTLLGGGSTVMSSSNSLQSRLSANVLAKEASWVNSCTSFNAIHNTEGVLGVYGTCAPESALKLVETVAKELKSLASTAPSEEEVQRAKAQLKTSVALSLDSTQVLMEDLGRQTLVFGKPLTDVSAKIDAVSSKDVQKLVQDMLKTKLTFTALGDVSQLPAYEKIAKLFQ